jgi:formate hydrogenlyase transcriptional activator
LAELRKSMGHASTLGSKFHDIERNTIIEALKAASGKIAGQGGAAERLGLKRTTLQNKMRRLSISKPDYRPG